MRAICVMWLAGAAAVVTPTFTVASAGQVGATWKPVYASVRAVGNAIKSEGIPYHGDDVAIENVSCAALRRYGVHRINGIDMFWRFHCHAHSLDNHSYDLQVATMTNARGNPWRVRFLRVTQAR